MRGAPKQGAQKKSLRYRIEGAARERSRPRLGCIASLLLSESDTRGTVLQSGVLLNMLEINVKKTQKRKRHKKKH